MCVAEFDRVQQLFWVVRPFGCHLNLHDPILPQSTPKQHQTKSQKKTPFGKDTYIYTTDIPRNPIRFWGLGPVGGQKQLGQSDQRAKRPTDEELTWSLLSFFERRTDLFHVMETPSDRETRGTKRRRFDGSFGFVWLRGCGRAEDDFDCVS